MTNEQLEWFRRLLADFGKLNDRPPDLAEWEDFVRENFSPGEEPLTKLSKASVLRLASDAHEKLATFETVTEELEVKARDAESNLNNRKYNFGNF